MNPLTTSQRRGLIAGCALSLTMILGGCARAEQDAPPKLTGDPASASPSDPTTIPPPTTTTTTTLFYPGQK